MSPAAGPPPVTRPPAVEQPKAIQNYEIIADTLRKNNGAEAKAIRAMFHGDRELADRFLSVCFSLLAAQSDLLKKATPISVVEAIKKAASLGLEPMTEDAAIVLYGDVATLQPMYRGYLKRIRRSGLVSAVDAVMVYENDEFDYWTTHKGHEFKHHPAKTRVNEDGQEVESRGGYWGAYAFAVMKDGFVFLRVMEIAEIYAIRDRYSRAKGPDSPWATAFDQMALKTVIRRLAKALPQEAVGLEFLELERQNDEAEQRVTQASQRVADATVSEIRNIALMAVNPTQSAQPPAAPPKEETDVRGRSEGSEEADPSDAETAAALAAMKLAEEQARRR